MALAKKLKDSLKEIIDKTSALIAIAPIRYSSNSVGTVIVIAPDYYWGELAADQKKQQIDLKREFDDWIELLKVVLRGSPEKINRALESAEKRIRRWIELKGNWSITDDRISNEKEMRKDAAEFDSLLDILSSGEAETTILIPDTNSLIQKPDPATYRSIIGVEKFTFLLLPSVLYELDKLKNTHKVPEFRDKVEKVITRIKGWREQGSLLTGITVDKSITIKAISAEPNMKSTLSGLDNSVLDDRIIASVLEIESKFHSSRVILLTGDINLQNKADAAKIECIDV